MFTGLWALLDPSEPGLRFGGMYCRLQENLGALSPKTRDPYIDPKWMLSPAMRVVKWTTDLAVLSPAEIVHSLS